ncbi:MAG: translation initiation factor IF-1 [Patescibacteria group bacterium]|nr:translation initiation factor IF-1 [Patescibacteria group bacterium]MDD5121382.1 translation initiation factor IF-1 [Patescibacteria group bacterium]MDD5221789.1 translation initiation factor IF-1 [Patescibacteria group bacterium]MDD5395699.1 translation initiation factor IF-1 [Patescibacteria group bacterium]
MGKKQDFLEVEGVVEEVLPSTTFKVKLDDSREILAYLSGRLRMNQIRILLGDRVRIEMSPYDLTKGRVTYRF